MTGFASFTSQNQLTLPSDLAKFIGFTPGEKLVVDSYKEGEVVIKKAGSLRELQGMLAGHLLSKKHSSDEIINLARKKKVARLMENDR